MQNRSAETAALKLVAYCQKNNWAGYDPYDALNSRAIQKLPFLDTRLTRLAATQILKRSPINLRPVMLIPRLQNPKAIGLFLSAFLKLSTIGTIRTEDLIHRMINRLIDLRSQDIAYWCWGYSFPWQARLQKETVAKGAPNLVCTSFVANALLDAYEQMQEPQCLNMAASAAEYILNELYWTRDDSPVAGFAYPVPEVRINTYNANFLASALLCRVYQHTREEKFLGPALKAARYSAAQQQADGSWYYGEAPSQRWIDNFHTGYNLCALQAIGRYAGTTEFESGVQRGVEFYRNHFFREDGAAKYFHNRSYPVDIHCVAQSIITLLAFKDLDPSNVELTRRVFEWAMNHMWDDRGFFYYRVFRLFTVRTSFMRWSQAWMLLAIATLLCESTARANIDAGTASAFAGMQPPQQTHGQPACIAD